ncbi:dual specificity protein phosphatase 15 [Clonorchis sinensis]|uniref:Dual specificity protein phosphatase 15 n=1 Tax=Clonorchis sinensis TaxID=79923 RepID=H2KP49_CLOSI|nr:dual specificity protein phosphatase 15 [Clonorchis sinensis]
MGGSMTKVLPGLYVGGLENAKDAEELIANCISHILVAQNHKYEIEKSASRKYLQIVMLENDDRSLFRRVAESNDFIHQARLESGNVLVCSDSGMSANVTLVAAYLMSVYHLDRSSALGALRGLKHAAHPVPALLAQLDQFDSASSPSCGPTSPVDPGSSATSESPRTPLPVVTSMSENLRLTEKFGSWPRLEEDMHLLQGAMNSHKSLAESDFVPYESQDIIDTETPPSEDLLRPSSPPALESFSPVTNNVHWTPPRTPPSTPISSVIPAGEHVTVPLEAITEIGKIINPTTEPNDENLCGGDQRTPTALTAPESGIFCLDTTEDPIPPPSPEPEQPTWPVITGRMHGPNSTEFGIDEVGLEPQAYVSEDGDDDDVPGAISIPASDKRISIAQSHRHGLAASYHAQSSLFDSSRHGSVPGAVARSLAPTGFAKPK